MYKKKFLFTCMMLIAFQMFSRCQEFDVRQVVSSDPRVARFSIDFERYSEGKRGQRNIICGLSICNPTDEVIPKVEQVSYYVSGYILAH